MTITCRLRSTADPSNAAVSVIVELWLADAVQALMRTYGQEMFGRDGDPRVFAGIPETSLRPCRSAAVLRRQIRRGVATQCEWRYPWLRRSYWAPQPSQGADQQSARLSRDSAALVLATAKAISSRTDIARLVRLNEVTRSWYTHNVDIPLSDLLTLHAAGFTDRDINPLGAEKRHYSILCRWAAAGFNAKQWRLVRRAGLQPSEVEEIISTRRFPDLDTLEMLVALTPTREVARRGE